MSTRITRRTHTREGERSAQQRRGMTVRTAHRAAGWPLSAVAACVGLAACGGAPAGHVAQLRTTTTASRSPTRGSTHDEALAYARCVRSHGVPLWPDPQSSGTFEKSTLTPHQLGASSSQIGKAEKACRSLAPTYSATQRSTRPGTGTAILALHARSRLRDVSRPRKQRRDRDPTCHGELACVPGGPPLLRRQVRGASAAQPCRLRLGWRPARPPGWPDTRSRLRRSWESASSPS